MRFLVAFAVLLALPRIAAADDDVVRSRGALFLRVGYGARTAFGEGHQGLHGTTFGLGYRRATDRYGFEVSALNLLVHQEDRYKQVMWDSYVRLAGFGYLRPGGTTYL